MLVQEEICQVEKIKMPVLMQFGKEDGMFPPQKAQVRRPAEKTCPRWLGASLRVACRPDSRWLEMVLS